MRVLMVSHYALPHLGGIEVALDAMATELQRRGHEVVHVASDAVRPDEPAGEPPTAYRVVRVPALNILEERTGAPWPVFTARLARILRLEVARADVVHAHGFLYMSSLAALAAARARGRRSPLRVLTEHVGNVRYESRALNAVEGLAINSIGRLGARAAEALVYINDGVGELLGSLAPGRLRRRIDNGVDTDRYRPAADGERARLREELGWDEHPRVLFVGRLVEKKGVGVAMSAAAAADGAFELVLVGPGRLASSAPAGVRSLGALPPDRVAELYRAADTFLLPSHGEGFPLTVQEAMASGLPVMLADEAAYRPHLEGARSGALLVTADPRTIAAELKTLLGDASRLAAASRDAAEHARRRFSWRAAADAHERLYQELAGERGLSGPGP